MYTGQSMAPMPGALGVSAAPYGPLASVVGPRGESPDDAHVMSKHTMIYPTEDELSAVQNLVINTEKSLKVRLLYFVTLEESALMSRRLAICSTMRV